MDALTAYLVPILATPALGFQAIHFDIPLNDSVTEKFTTFRRRHREASDYLESHPTLKEFSCTGRHINFWMAPPTPCLETVRITTSHDPEYGPDVLERLYGLESMSGDRDQTRPCLGCLPTRTTSGSVTHNLRGMIRYLPSVTLFQAGYIANQLPFPPSDSSEGLQSLHVQTFTKGTKTLIHCWTGAQCNLFNFGRHDSSYRQRGETWVDEPCLSKEGSIEHGYNFSPYNEPEPLDTTGSGVTGTTGVPGLFEFTYYQVFGRFDGSGWHLPFVLLDHVYSQVEYERMPSRGRIGLKLPAHVWQVLDDWDEGVQSLMIDPPKASQDV